MFVIYKDMIGYCVTTEKNYNAFIRDTRAVQKMYDFATADEILDYYAMYCGIDKSNFKVVTK